MKRSLFLAASGALVASTATAQTLISENFEGGMANMDFTVVDDGTLDGTQDFAFDYVAAGIPLAPRSDAMDTLGLRLTVNDTANATDSITCFHNTVVSAPRYRLKVDAFMNFGAGSGTTEYAHVGVAGDGVTYNGIFASGEGTFFSYTGDGGSGSSDYRVHRAAAITPGMMASGTLAVSDPAHLGKGCNNFDPFFQDLFPMTNGSPSNIWTTVMIEVDSIAGIASFYLDGTLVYRAQTTGSMDGQASLCLTDFFSSLSTANNFALYDNLTVEEFHPGLCSQSSDSVTVQGGLVACADNGTGEVIENQWLRRYSPSGDCGVTGDYTVTGVNWAAGVAVSTAGVQPLQIRAYTIPAGAPFLYANMTLLADEAIMLPDTTNTLQSTTFASPVLVPAGEDLVLEIAKTTGLGFGASFRPGANTFGETGPTYIASSPCAIDDPVDLAAIGFGGVAMILDPVCGIGESVCSPAEPNSTGTPAYICAIGSDVAVVNDLTLSVVNLPQNSNGFFFTSEELNVLPIQPASVGHICIASLTVGRYDTAIQNSGMSGAVSLAIDLTAIPQVPGGPVAVMAGDTRYWQYWYRDVDPAGATTSNYSDAICVTFQ